MSGSTRSFEMAKRLVALGHEVVLITSWREKDDRKGWFVTEEEGIHVHWLPNSYSNHMGFRARVMSFLKFAWSASHHAASQRGDIVFATSTPLTIAIPGIYASKKMSVPMVFEVRDMWPDIPIAIGALRNPVLKWLARLLELKAYEHSSAIVALSPGMKEGIVAKGFSSKAIEVIPNASDITEFSSAIDTDQIRTRREYGIPEKAILVLYAGTFGRINGVTYFVELANKLRDKKNVHFMAIGGGAEFASVKLLAEKLGCLGVNLQLHKQVSKEAMPQILAAADIATSLVIPIKELEANSANKVFDAFAAGRCVVVNHGGWIANLLESSGAGFRLSTDTDEAASQLMEWADDPDSIKQAGIAAKRLAEQSFSRDRLASQLDTLLRSVVAQGIST